MNMDDLYPRLLGFVREQPWALLPEKLAVMADLLRFRSSGGRLTPDEVRSRIETGKNARARQRYYDPESDDIFDPHHDPETGQLLGYRSAATGATMQQGRQVVAVLGIYGLISQRASMVDDLSGPGATSIERLTAQVRAALADQAVRAIVFDVDSPGGGVYGVQELADEIRDARGTKPMFAVANSLAASAAYWLATSADELAVTPSGEVGSVGVYAAHEDMSKALEEEGVKVTLVSAGKFKTEGNPFEPLSEEAAAYMQARVDDYYNAFVRAVAKSRGVGVEDVRRGFGQGRVVGASQAVEMKMADRTATLDETIRRAGGRSGAPAQRAAVAPAAPVTSAPPQQTPAHLAELEAASVRARTL
jgi:signal peptide peptidase SppA